MGHSNNHSTLTPAASIPNPATSFAFPVVGKRGIALPSTWGNSGNSEPCWYLNPCSPSQEGQAPPIPGKARVPLCGGAQDPPLLFLSSALLRSPFLGRGGAVCPGSGWGGLGYWGGQKELWQCVYIGWPGEGTMLREDMGAPGCGSIMLYPLLSLG